MKKIDARTEKREKNEEYAKRFKDKKKKVVKGKKATPKFANWCRISGHPASCSCAYPLRSELIPGGKARSA